MKQMTNIGKLFSKFKNSGLMQMFSGKQQAKAESAGQSIFKQILGNVNSTQSFQKSNISPFGDNVDSSKIKDTSVPTNNKKNTDSPINIHTLGAKNKDRVRQFIINPSVSVKMDKDVTGTVEKNTTKNAITDVKKKSVSNINQASSKEQPVTNTTENVTDDIVKVKKYQKTKIDANSAETQPIIGMPHQVNSNVEIKKNTVSIVEKPQEEFKAQAVETVSMLNSVEKSDKPLESKHTHVKHAAVSTSKTLVHENAKVNIDTSDLIPVIKQEKQNNENVITATNNKVNVEAKSEKNAIKNPSVVTEHSDANIAQVKADSNSDTRTSIAQETLRTSATIAKAANSNGNLNADKVPVSFDNGTSAIDNQKTDLSAKVVKTEKNTAEKSPVQTQAPEKIDQAAKPSTVSAVDRIHNNAKPIVQNNDNVTRTEIETPKTSDTKNTTVAESKPVQDNITVKNNLQSTPKVENKADYQTSNKPLIRGEHATNEIKDTAKNELITSLQNNSQNSIKAESLRMTDPAIESVSYSKSENVNVNPTVTNHAKTHENFKVETKAVSSKTEKETVTNSESITRNAKMEKPNETLVPDNSKSTKSVNSVNLEPTVINTKKNKTDIAAPSIKESGSVQNKVVAETKASVQSASTAKQSASVKNTTASVIVNDVKSENTKPAAKQQASVENNKIDTVTSNNSKKVESIPKEIKSNTFADTEINKLTAKREMKLMTLSEPEIAKTDSQNTDAKSVAKADQGVDTKNVITKIKQFIVKSNQSDNAAQKQSDTPLAENKNGSVNIETDSTVKDGNKIKTVSTPGPSVSKTESKQVKDDAVIKTSLNEPAAKVNENKVVVDAVRVSDKIVDTQNSLTVSDKINTANNDSQISLVDEKVQLDEKQTILALNKNTERVVTEKSNQKVIEPLPEMHTEKNNAIKSTKPLMDSIRNEYIATASAEKNIVQNQTFGIVNNTVDQKKETTVTVNSNKDKFVNSKINTDLNSSLESRVSVESEKSDKAIKPVSKVKADVIAEKSTAIVDEKQDNTNKQQVVNKFSVNKSQGSNPTLQNPKVTEYELDDTKFDENTFQAKTGSDTEIKSDSNKKYQSKTVVPNTSNMEVDKTELKDDDSRLQTKDTPGKTAISESMIAKNEKNSNIASETVEQPKVSTNQKQVLAQSVSQAKSFGDADNVENKHVFVAASENKPATVNKTQSNSNQTQTAKPVTLVTEKAVTEEFQKDMGSNEQNLSEQSNFKGQTVFSNSAVNNATFSSQMNANIVASKSEISYLSQQIHEGYEMLLNRSTDEKLALSARTAELGLLRIELTKQDNDVQIVLKVQSEQSQRMLEQAMPELRQSLSKSQVQVQELRIVSSENSDQQDMSRQHAFNRQRQEQQNNQNNSAISKSRTQDKQYTEFQSVYETLA